MRSVEDVVATGDNTVVPCVKIDLGQHGKSTSATISSLFHKEGGRRGGGENTTRNIGVDSTGHLLRRTNPTLQQDEVGVTVFFLYFL